VEQIGGNIYGYDAGKAERGVVTGMSADSQRKWPAIAGHFRLSLISAETPMVFKKCSRKIAFQCWRKVPLP